MAGGIRQLMWSGYCGCWSEKKGTEDKKGAGGKKGTGKGDGGYFIWAGEVIFAEQKTPPCPNKISSVPFLPYLIHLKQSRRTHAATDAHSTYDKFGTASLAFDQGVADHAGSAHAVRVAD